MRDYVQPRNEFLSGSNPIIQGLMPRYFRGSDDLTIPYWPHRMNMENEDDLAQEELLLTEVRMRIQQRPAPIPWGVIPQAVKGASNPHLNSAINSQRRNDAAPAGPASSHVTTRNRQAPIEGMSATRNQLQFDDEDFDDTDLPSDDYQLGRQPPHQGRDSFDVDQAPMNPQLQQGLLDHGFNGLIADHDEADEFYTDSDDDRIGDDLSGSDFDDDDGERDGADESDDGAELAEYLAAQRQFQAQSLPGFGDGDDDDE